MIKKLLYNLNLIKKEHCIQPFVYVNKYGVPVKRITNTVKWFKETTITCKKKELDKYINNLIEEKYPKYKGYIHIY